MLKEINTNNDATLIKNVRILDVRSGVLGEPTNVTVAGGILKDLNAGASSVDCDVIDGKGFTMIPGLINCHAHILSPYLSEQKGTISLWALKQMPRNLEETLAAGVVCLRDLLSPIGVLNRMRRKVDAGKIPGPEVVAAGAVLSCKGGYPEFVVPLFFPISTFAGQPKMNLQTPRKAVAMVRHLKKCGAEVAKIGYTSYTRDFKKQERMPTISDAVFDAICDTAHELGMKVSVHHNWTEDLKPILRADIDTLEHLTCDRELNDEEVAKIKEKGVTVVPTLSVADSMARFEEKKNFLESDRAREVFEEKARQHLLWISSTWLDFNNERYQDVFGIWRADRGRYAIAAHSARKLHEAGVTLCAGTDLGAVVVWPGELADEIKRLNQIGLSRLEAIQSATINAARVVGREGVLGTVESGKRSDVVLIEGNPLEDLDALRKVRLVGKGGRWYEPTRDSVPDYWLGHNVLFDYENYESV